MAASGSTVPKSDAANATKEKLASMLDGLSEFESMMKTGTRQRREKDEHRIAELKSDIQAVEQRVAEEARKRVEASHALQSWAAAQVLGTRTRLEAQLSSSQATIQARMEELSGRIDSLERQFAAE
jgi:polyhydroxyalkanoate synthesis regulator phasin